MKKEYAHSRFGFVEINKSSGYAALFRTQWLFGNTPMFSNTISTLTKL